MNFQFSCPQHDRTGWTLAVHAKRQIQGENQWSVVSLERRIPAKRPSIESNLGILKSLKPNKKSKRTQFPALFQKINWAIILWQEKQIQPW
jgi:hypothetical protein